MRNAAAQRDVTGFDEVLSHTFSERIDALLRASFGFFFFLYYLDALTTILLLRLFPNTFEYNSFFAPLLSGTFPEIAGALVLKLLIITPLIVVISWPLRGTEFEVTIKALKLGVFAGIIALTPFMTWVALGNNLSSLITLALSTSA